MLLTPSSDFIRAAWTFAPAAVVACCAVLGTSARAGEPCAPAWDAAVGTPGIGGLVTEFALFDSGSGAGAQLYAAGQFGIAGGGGASNIARWNGAAWSAVGGGLINNWVSDLVAHDGKLYAGGYFDSAAGAPGSAKVAFWDGTQWTGLNAQLEAFSDSVWALESFDDDGRGADLYVGGNYFDIGGQGLDFIARWDGKAFSSIGGTIAGAGIPLIVLDLEIFDPGDGPRLIAGGRFATIGGVAASHIGAWNGSTWSSLGSGITGTQVITMEVFDDGSGPALFVGGTFTAAGGVPATRIAKWDGSTWSALGDGLSGTVQGMAAYDDGSGEALYVVGNFTASGAMPLNHIARWDGRGWSAVGAGLNDNGFAAIRFDDGGGSGGESLFVGGAFVQAGGAAANGVAEYVGCPVSNSADLNGDGVVNGLDLGILLANWSIPAGAPGCGGVVPCESDLNGDGVVDGLDLGILLASWTL